MVIDIAWWEGVVAGLGWGVLVGGVLGVRWVIATFGDDEDGKGGRS